MVEIDLETLDKAVCGGSIYADDACKSLQFKGLVWDSREVKPKNIFLAMPGERVDGNDYIEAAISAGAGCVLCTREPELSTKTMAAEFMCPIIVIMDGIATCSLLARWWRQKLHAVVVGITGSAGKTSTKEFVANVLQQQFKTCATIGNHNNELGVPATILSADKDCEALVVEMGMRGLGQIGRLAEVVRPSIGIITNVGTTHMELLGSQQKIAEAKAELFDCIKKDGLAIYNADDEYADFVCEVSNLGERGVEKRSFGLSDKADVWAENIKTADNACCTFDIHFKDTSHVYEVHLNVPGKHSVSNALSAAVVGQYLGMSPEKIIAGLKATCPTNMRMQIVKSKSGATFLNDAYNANPAAMKEALDTLAHMKCTGRRYAVLGDMAELGAAEFELHRQVGMHVFECKIDRLICVGVLAAEIGSAAIEAGMPSGAVQCFEKRADASKYLNEQLEPNDIVLLKASRVMELEKMIEEK